MTTPHTEDPAEGRPDVPDESSSEPADADSTSTSVDSVRLQHDDELADEMSLESFPTSDPPSTWAGADHG